MGMMICYTPYLKEKRELGATDTVYRDEACIAIVLERFPCYCSEMGKEEWVFEFEEPDGERTIEGCVTLKGWNITFENIDRGRIKLTLPDEPESILPDGLEIEGGPTIGDSTRLNVHFEDCDGDVANQTINFRQEFINGTGGHNHTDPAECGPTSENSKCNGRGIGIFSFLLVLG